MASEGGLLEEEEVKSRKRDDKEVTGAICHAFSQPSARESESESYLLRRWTPRWNVARYTCAARALPLDVVTMKMIHPKDGRESQK